MYRYDGDMKKTPSEDSPHNNASSHQEEAPPQKRKIASTDKLKFIGLLVFLVVIIGIGVALLPYFEHLTSEEGRQYLVQVIKDAGVWGVGVCLLLQFIQIVVAFIPGEVTQLAIGAIYGPLFGTLITLGGALVSSIFVFYLVRKLGAPFVQGMIGSKDSKILNFFKKDSRLNVLTFILFLIPGLPKDVFTYLFPLTEIRPINFFVLSTLGRIPGIAASAFIGSSAMQGDYTQAIIVGIIAGGLGLLGIIFNKQILGVVDKVEDSLRSKKSSRR